MRDGDFAEARSTDGGDDNFHDQSSESDFSAEDTCETEEISTLGGQNTQMAHNCDDNDDYLETLTLIVSTFSVYMVEALFFNCNI